MFTTSQLTKIQTVLSTETRKDGGRNNLFINAENVIAKMKAQNGRIKRVNGAFKTVMNGSKGEVYTVTLHASGSLSCGCKFFETNRDRQSKGCKHTIALVKTLAKA
tara:strand:+ start:3758 stop:4075 length:318 start_codon:yes stop_codon:yes gene_type:complete